MHTDTDRCTVSSAIVCYDVTFCVGFLCNNSDISVMLFSTGQVFYFNSHHCLTMPTSGLALGWSRINPKTTNRDLYQVGIMQHTTLSLLWKCTS